MKPTTQSTRLQVVHPFPARMAPEIALNELRGAPRRLRVLDPMAGSGTTIMAARANGHQAIGFDTDPLAVTISRGWCQEANPKEVRRIAKSIVSRVAKTWKALSLRCAYPFNADEETKEFVRFWFDATNRKQLTCLSREISGVRNDNTRTFLWCAFSRLIITKESGASLAMDLAHSRPHRVYDQAPVRPIEKFLNSVERVLQGNYCSHDDFQNSPAPVIERADARFLPLRKNTVDLVITSPPYLNAIDYVRCSKFSLVWMGHSCTGLRKLRASNIGCERKSKKSADLAIKKAIGKMGAVSKLSEREQGMITSYLQDMNQVISELKRVLRPGGKIVLVVGNSTLRGVYLSNSNGIAMLARNHGLKVCSVRRRTIPDSSRYLPPPKDSRRGIERRMRQEVILQFKKYR
jgi:tRNA G10  N-methylase Trm11